MILVRGVLVFILAQIAANFLGLTTISWLINQLITYGVIAAVVIFSPEIRTGLERLGRATDFFSNTPMSSEEQMVQAFVKSVELYEPAEDWSFGSCSTCENLAGVHRYRNSFGC